MDVQITERDGAAADGVVYRQVLGRPERTKRALIALGICWGLALASLPVFFFHFFLVPFFALTGAVLFFLRLRQERIVLGALLDCPSCQATTRLGKQSDDWPLLLACQGCNTKLTIQNLSAATGT